jgi:hypothetical protein
MYYVVCVLAATILARRRLCENSDEHFVPCRTKYHHSCPHLSFQVSERVHPNRDNTESG